jgi:hypothetical protein
LDFVAFTCQGLRVSLYLKASIPRRFSSDSLRVRDGPMLEICLGVL